MGKVRTAFALVTIIISLSYFPRITSAAECRSDGYTMVFINGILTSEESAKESLDKLKDRYTAQGQYTDVAFILGHNPSHLAGAGDIIQSVFQALDGSVSDFDLQTILLQIHPEVRTRKILLVGHSQGTFYTNEMYEYLVRNGVPRESIAVYNLATPAGLVAGGGDYLTSENDNLIRKVRALTAAAGTTQPLPANATIPLSYPEEPELWRGHKFSGEYLAGAPLRIVSDISQALGGLVAGSPPETTEGCFAPPADNFGYRIRKAAFAVADPAARGAVGAAGTAVAGYVSAANAIASMVQGAVSAVADAGSRTVNAAMNAGKFLFGAVTRFSGDVNDRERFAANVSGFGTGGKSEPVGGEVELGEAAGGDNGLSSNTGAETGRADAADAKDIPNGSNTPGGTDKSDKTDAATAHTEGKKKIDGPSAPTSTPPQSAGATFETAFIVVPSGGGSPASSAGSGSAPSGDSGASSAANHVVISEAQVAGAADAGDEFIELYNPTGSAADISSWSIQYVSGIATSTATVLKKNFQSGNSVPARGFFLVTRALSGAGDDGYLGVKAGDMSHRAFTLSGEANGATVFLVNDQADVSGASDPNIVDRLGYGTGGGVLAEGQSAAVPPAGQSVERKAFVASCATPSGENEYRGNGCDTDANASDFVMRTAPNPQNSQSLPEPRSAPTIVSFAATYNPAPRYDFSWSASSDALGATSTNRYTLRDITSASASTTIAQATSALAASSTIDEIGKNYIFEFNVQDVDGYAASSASTVAAPSFLDHFSWYRDPRTGATGYAVELKAASSRPMWDLADGSGTQNWKLLVLYLNHDAPKEASLSTSNSLKPADTNLLRLHYQGCNGSTGGQDTLLFPNNTSSCQSGGALSFALATSELEDLRFALKSASSTSDADFLSTDYVTLAFYDFEGGGSGVQTFRLAAADRTKYYFAGGPSGQSAPAAPASITAAFDALHSSVSLSWPAATDPDTRDSLLTYQHNFSTSTQFDAGTWQSTGAARAGSAPITVGPTYLFGARALDDFNNSSTPATLSWTAPSWFVAAPFQSERTTVVGQTGGGQKLSITATTTIDQMALWGGKEGGVYCCAESYLEIRTDASDSPGNVIASSTAATIGSSQEQKENIYEFAPGVTLASNASYWLVPQRGTNTNNTRFYGSAGDAYAGGYWSADAGKDAYFYLRVKE